MTPRDRSPRHGEAGFVLIGVVIFVLALTIIGISLFSLSSYEAQFLQRSIDREQAFQSAMGGIERAKFVLSVPLSGLESVAQNLPEGVSAVAIQVLQNGDSVFAGEVLWDSLCPVLIRVTAGPAGARRMVEGRFTPVRPLNYYSSLITVSEGIEVEHSSPSAPVNRNRTVLLDGPVWESSGQNPSLWLQHLLPPEPVDIRESPEVPVPGVAPFLTRPGPIDGATLITATGRPGDPIILNASGTPGVSAYFRAKDTDANFSFNSYPYDTLSPQSSCTIQVSGLAVWLLPRGALFNQGTVITGNPATDCLVVIAGPMTGGLGQTEAERPDETSIMFLGSLQANIPVILVSSGEVLLWHENDWDMSTSTNDLAIFARSARFMGPDPTHDVLQLHRYPNGPLNTRFLDALASQDALPNAPTAGGRRLDLIPGTWQASDR